MSFRYTDEEIIELQEKSKEDLLDSIGLDRNWFEQHSLPHASPLDSPFPGNDADSVPDGEIGGNIAGITDGQTKLPKEALKRIYSLYSLQSQYTARLDGIRADGVAEFKALSSPEKTSASKISIAKKCISRAMSAETECDAKVASILQELRTILHNGDFDESIVNQLDDYYVTQKGLLKAEYIRKYNKYLK